VGILPQYKPLALAGALEGQGGEVGEAEGEGCAAGLLGAEGERLASGEFDEGAFLWGIGFATGGEGVCKETYEAGCETHVGQREKV